VFHPLYFYALASMQDLDGAPMGEDLDGEELDGAPLVRDFPTHQCTTAQNQPRL
jgi:hypothetical protein